MKTSHRVSVLIGLLAVLFCVGVCHAADPSDLYPLLNEQITRAHRASPQEWPKVREALSEQLRSALRAYPRLTTRLDDCLRSVSRALDNSRQLTYLVWIQQRSSLLTRLRVIVDDPPPSETLMYAVSSAEPSQWEGLRTDIKACYARLFRARGASDETIRAQLERLHELFDLCRDSERLTVTDSLDEEAYVTSLDAIVATGSGHPTPMPSLRGNNVHAEKIAAFLVLVLLLPPLLGWRVTRWLRRGEDGRRAAVRGLLKRRALRAALKILWVLVAVEIGCRVILASPELLWRLRSWTQLWLHESWVQSHQPDAGAPDDLYSDPSTAGRWQYDPLRGWAVTPYLRNVSVPFHKLLNSNSHGLRGTREYSYDKPPGKTRILILGDSYTFGEEANDDETFPALLEKSLPDTEVLNFGVTGYGQDQCLQYFEQEGVKYHPDVVVLGFLTLDMKRNPLTFSFAAKSAYVWQNGRLVLTGVPVPTPHQVLWNDCFRFKSWALVRMMRARSNWMNGGQDEVFSVTRDITAHILDELVKRIRGIGAVPVFVYLPNAEEELGDDDEIGVFTEASRYYERGQVIPEEPFLKDYCARNHVDFFSVVPAMHAGLLTGQVRWTQRFPRHYDPAEATVIAEALRQHLVEQRLVPVKR